MALSLLRLDARDVPRRAGKTVEQGLRRGFVLDAKLLVVEPLAADLEQLRRERRRVRSLEPRFDRPVLDRLERLDLALALDDHADRDRLHAAGGQPAADLLPEQRRELIADQAIENPPRGLRLEQLLVDLGRVLQRLL